MFVYLCVRVCMHTVVRVYTHTYSYICASTHTNIGHTHILLTCLSQRQVLMRGFYACMCECLCIHTNMSLCVSISIYLCTCTRAHILMYTYIDIGYTSRRETLMWDIDAGVRVCVCVYMRVCVHTYIHFHLFCTYVVIYRHGVATCSRLHKIIGLFCKRAPWKRRYSAKETCNFKEPSNRSHPILATRLNKREALMRVYVCVCVCVCVYACVCVRIYIYANVLKMDLYTRI